MPYDEKSYHTIDCILTVLFTYFLVKIKKFIRMGLSKMIKLIKTLYEILCILYQCSFEQIGRLEVKMSFTTVMSTEPFVKEGSALVHTKQNYIVGLLYNFFKVENEVSDHYYYFVFDRHLYRIKSSQHAQFSCIIYSTF